MDTAILTALIAGQMAQIAGIRQTETDARNAISGNGLEQMIGELFPSVDSKLLTANKDVVNHLQQGVNRYVRALTRGTLNWEWDGENEPPELNPGVLLNKAGRDLVQDATTDALVTGKFAYSYIGPDNRLRLSTLTGFLWPIYEAGDSSEVQAVLQVTSYVADGKTLFQVRRFSPGMMEVFRGLEDWQKYATGQKEEFPQPHSPDRLPIAFRVVGRDANREPEGLAMTALPAFRRYVKAAVLLAFIAHRGGFEERVAKSDQLFQLAKSDPRNPVLGELKKVGPNIVRVLDSSGSYERLEPVKLAEYREQERDAKADVRGALYMPDVDGADLSGEALAEKRESYTETTTSLGNSVADALTEAHELAAAMRPAELRSGWRVTLKPHFTRDVESARVALREDYKAGLPLSAWLSGLQNLGVTEVTEAHINAALAQEEAGTLPRPNGA
ncbi:hypothetical protein [Deinococcus wulumuqiensis]|uniref:hypothetical protein n=1 Tax=Deinococcus wulumuqiensis TaxID=980427 RepID=UPI00242B19B9|nr:hypothetical protein [Deinococcus wulumuqiensis]